MPRGQRRPADDEYLIAVAYRRAGNTLYARTERGRNQVTRNWMKKYPRMFTCEALRSVFGNCRLKHEKSSVNARARK